MNDSVCNAAEVVVAVEVPKSNGRLCEWREEGLVIEGLHVDGKRETASSIFPSLHKSTLSIVSRIVHCHV